MEEFNIQGKQTSFYKYCPGTFVYTLVYYLLLIYVKGKTEIKITLGNLRVDGMVLLTGIEK